MTTSRSRLVLLALPFAALALAGCGGGGSGGGGGGVDTNSAAYQGGFELCSAQTAHEIGNENGIDNATPEQAADVSAEMVADRKSTRLNSSHLKLSRMPSSA